MIRLELTYVTLPMVIFVEGVTLTVVDDVMFEPLMVTVVAVPRLIAVGDMEVITGAAAVTVKVTLLLVPPAVVTVMLFAPVVALAAITNVAVIRVEVTVGVPLRVIPVGRFSVAPVRFVPVKATDTVAP